MLPPEFSAGALSFDKVLPFSSSTGSPCSRILPDERASVLKFGFERSNQGDSPATRSLLARYSLISVALFADGIGFASRLAHQSAANELL
jgi:hypothetical protein